MAFLDAWVQTVIHNEDGSGELRLGGGESGHLVLNFARAPHEVMALNGMYIWGNDSFVKLGGTEIAKRRGSRIKFVDDKTFKRAVIHYHNRHYASQN